MYCHHHTLGMYVSAVKGLNRGLFSLREAVPVFIIYNKKQKDSEGEGKRREKGLLTFKLEKVKRDNIYLNLSKSNFIDFD